MRDRRLLLCALASTLLVVSPAGADDAYPSRTISMVVGYAAGGLTDVMSRTIADRMRHELGQAIIVENKTGAATSIASTHVSRARPDGYTLLMGTSTLAINPALQPNLTPRDPKRDLVPIGTGYHTPFLLLVSSTVPARSLAEFIAYAKANPDRVNVGSSGVGAVNHLLLEMFNRRAGVKMVHVPYRGAAPTLMDLREGRIQATFATPMDAVPVARENKGRILAVTSASRIPLLPDTPAVAETFPGFNGVFWQALFAPAGTPEPVVKRLAAALRAATEDKELRARVGERGVVMTAGGPDDLRRLLETETDAWGKLIRDAEIKPE